MPSITLKNIPPELYDLLKASATANRRSITGEIVTHIERGVRGRRVDPEALLARARELRSETQRHPISTLEVAAAKRLGRP